MTAPKGQRDAIFTAWAEWAEELWNHLVMGYMHQAIWREFVQEMQHRFPDADATFLVSYTRLYVDAQVMLVRRLVDDDTDTRSLTALIHRIGRNPTVMTRERLLGHIEDDDWLRGDEARWWSEWFADPADPEHVLGDRREAHRKLLTDELAHLVAWADKTIAHLDPTKPSRVLLYSEIGKAFDVLAIVLNRYRRLLGRGETDDWTPTFLGDWHEPFRPSLFPLPNSVHERPDPGGFT